MGVRGRFLWVCRFGALTPTQYRFPNSRGVPGGALPHTVRLRTVRYRSVRLRTVRYRTRANVRYRTDGWHAACMQAYVRYRTQAVRRCAVRARTHESPQAEGQQAVVWAVPSLSGLTVAPTF